MKRSALLRRSPLRPRTWRITRRADKPAPKVKRSAPSNPLTAERRREVVERDGCCRSCGQWDPMFGLDPHHRKLKGAGGTPDPAIHALSNLVMLCRACHDYAHANPAEARVQGWIVRTLPEARTTPIDSYTGRLWLTDDGRALLNDPHTPTGDNDE